LPDHHPFVAAQSVDPLNQKSATSNEAEGGTCRVLCNYRADADTQSSSAFQEGNERFCVAFIQPSSIPHQPGAVRAYTWA
jgi:hypothetical protein